MQYYSRLQKRYDKLSERKALGLLILAIFVVIIVAYFGLNALLNMTSVISGLRKQPAVVNEEVGINPMVPQFTINYTATNSAQISLSGIADPGVTVNLYQNDILRDNQVADNDGKFSFDVLLNSGDNSFSAEAVSVKNKKSGKSDPYTVTYSKSQPKLEVNIKDGDVVTDSPIKITGSTVIGSSVTINDHLAIAGSGGSFSYYLTLQNGDNKVKIISTDQAGNQTTKELTIKYQQ